jgi:probable HAF family extracellular repeat protein
MKTRMSQMLKRTAGVALLVCLAASVAFAQVDPGGRAMMLRNNGQAGEQANRPNGRMDLTDPFGVLHHQHLALPDPGTEALDAVKLGLAKKKTYTFSTADYPGGDSSDLTDANGSTAVGYFAFSVQNLVFTAFTLTGNDYQILSIPGSVGSQPAAINTAGQIVGTFTDAASVNHGFVDTAGTIITIDFPGSDSTTLFDINDGGEMVGSYIDAASNIHGFLDNGGVFAPINYPGSLGTVPIAINTAGAMVGIWEDAATNVHGFLDRGGVFTSLDFPFATLTQATGINDSGEIAGSYVDAATVTHGFVYSNGAWSTVDVAGATNTALFHIKNNGNVTGTYSDGLTEDHGIKGH